MKLGFSYIVFFTLFLIGCEGGGGSTSASDCTSLETDLAMKAATYFDASEAGTATGAQCDAMVAGMQAYADGGCDEQNIYTPEYISNSSAGCAELHP